MYSQVSVCVLITFIGLKDPWGEENYPFSCHFLPSMRLIQGIQWVFKKERKGRRTGRYMNKPYTGDWLTEQCLPSLYSSCDPRSFPLTHKACVVVSISLSIAKWNPSSELRNDLFPSSFQWASPHLSLNYAFSHLPSPPASSAAPAKPCYIC